MHDLKSAISLYPDLQPHVKLPAVLWQIWSQKWLPTVHSSTSRIKQRSKTKLKQLINLWKEEKQRSYIGRKLCLIEHFVIHILFWFFLYGIELTMRLWIFVRLYKESTRPKRLGQLEWKRRRYLVMKNELDPTDMMLKYLDKSFCLYPGWIQNDTRTWNFRVC